MADPETSVAIDLLAQWVDGYINGMSPEEFQRLLSKSTYFLEGESYDTHRDPGDEDDAAYGHGV